MIKATNHSILRVFRIYIQKECGTCFSVEYREHQYLVTAKHLFKDVGYPSKYKIGLLQNHKIESFECEIRYSEDVDIAVLKFEFEGYLFPVTPIEYGLGGSTYGEEVFFIGYPLDYDFILQNLPSSKNPIPFVKSAIVSCFLNECLFALDGINNPGFSGSPIFRNEGTKTILIGVISGYRYNIAPVFEKVEKVEKETDLYIKENTGIIYGYSIQKAFDLIDKYWIKI